MNVGENVAFGLRMHAAKHTQDRVHEMLALVGLEGFGPRDVNSLSGGERQRVALARSLAPSPRLLMLDEPLGSLDAALRERLVTDLRSIIKRVGLTAIYVTHDQQEAFAVADRMAVMNAGRIEQAAAPEVVYRQPQTEFVARFLGLDNIVPVLRQEADEIVTPIGRFTLDTPASQVLIHPLGIHLADVLDTDIIECRLVRCVFAGDRYQVEIEHDSGIRLTFHVAAYTASIPEVGSVIPIRIDPAQVVPLA
jgi:thiamine transport system ATP-binding protein